MALVRTTQGEASSSNSSRCSSHRCSSYHMFMSFRGEDTRKTFTDHLYTALVNARFCTFWDNNELERGEDIKPELQKAIQQSQSSVIVFSKDYALSRWCLDELVMILGCKRTYHDHVVLLVFYDVDPYKVNRWRAAFTEIADLAGMVLQNQADGYESKFIKKIVKVVGEKLSCTPLSVAPFMFGMHSFIENIREISQHTHGLVKIQRQLLYGILNGIKVKIHCVSEGISKIEDVITSKGVLLVLDDVDHVDQLDAVLRMKNRFYPGSIIVITTRRSRLLKGHRVTKVLDVETLDYDESLELFGRYAFGQDYPIEGYLEYSEKAMYHCGGLPLALKVLRSSLLGESIGVWKSAFEKLEAIPNVEIMNKLRISYDDYDRKLFLHIACFFIQTFSHFLV
ncbi:hypothetical protein PRUPE_2G126000 [Prunus persica]|uniref:TIR domain-containing protein n=1 Tax=Prunus persica TaxID=3760 RepID=A0A251QEX5_PRUPE|nr:hypothetical protein PRUPE_2G126000 [Prunus persica]